MIKGLSGDNEQGTEMKKKRKELRGELINV